MLLSGINCILHDGDAGRFCSEAVDAIDPDDYLDILKKIVLAKAGTIKDADTYDGRTRLFRFALSRGFEPDLVAGVIRGLASGEDIR